MEIDVIMKMQKWVFLVLNRLNSMEMKSQIIVQSIVKMFKIDLIVWKCNKLFEGGYIKNSLK